jgi:chromosome segregation ATPase
MPDPGIGTRGSIDLLTALDLLGKAEAQVAELRDQVKGAELDAGFHRADTEQALARVAELEAAPVKLLGVIDRAVTALCNLAEELEPTHREIAERIWDLTNERLESPVLAAAVRQEKP